MIVATGSSIMTRTDHNVLLVSDDPSLIDRLVPWLRRSNLSVHRVVPSSRASEAVRNEASDLVLVAMPFRDTVEILTAARSSESVNDRAALLAVIDCQREEHAEILARDANRVLPTDCSRSELEDAVTSLLEVAPRAEIRAPIQLRFGTDTSRSPLYRLDNLSVSGMFIGGVQDLALGSQFGFALKVPGRERPILGKAEVVRRGDPEREGMAGLGARFLALGGEGPQILQSLVEREIEETANDERGPAALPQTPPRPSSREGPGGRSEAVGPRELASHREELEEISAHLDELLARGLRRRLGVVDWYVTGVELGLESLHAFSEILEQVYFGTTATSEGERRLSDLRTVHRALTEFAEPEQEVESRVRIMLEIRRPLERLLFELSETGRSEDSTFGDAAERGMVAQLTSDVTGHVRHRRSLLGLRRALVELQRFRYLVARRARRRRLRELIRRFDRLRGSLDFEDRDRLHTRRGRRRALVAVREAIDRLDDRLRAIHDRVYRRRFRDRASGDLLADLARNNLYPVVADVLAEGSEYLVRAYSAYRHALEVTDSDTGLLDRAARLAVMVEGSEGGRERDSRRALGG